MNSGSASHTLQVWQLRRIGFLALAISLLVGVILASLVIGSKAIPLDQIWLALTGGDAESTAEATVIGLRLPRVAAGLVAGVCLGLAGAVIQAVTRNPLADPGILGVSSGAALAVALAVGVFSITAPQVYIWFAFFGALAATVAVYLLSSIGRGNADPARLVLAGMAMGAVLSGVAGVIRLSDRQAFNAMTAWEVGSIAGRDWADILPVIPFAVTGVILTFAISPALNALAMGDDIATSLGANVLRIRVLSVISVTLMAGTATAIAGPIGFVGLMIPHLARWMAGPSWLWIMALTLPLAPTLLIAADILGRVVAPPGELQVATLTAFFGAPVLIAIARRGHVRPL